MRTRAKGERVETITTADLEVMIAIVAKLDPGDYVYQQAKAVIYRCRSLVAADPDRLVIQP